MPTEDLTEVGETLRRNGGEFGATTGRPRRCGWLDIYYRHAVDHVDRLLADYETACPITPSHSPSK